jgi:polynucleotide 5'-kinase involved in rRNA processing
VNQGFNFRLAEKSEEIDLEKSLPAAVQTAQRKAQWLGMIEKCEEHSVDLSETVLSGSRLGAGEPIGEARKTKLGLDGAYVEVSGTTLYLVTEADFSDDTISTALDVTGCSRAHFVSPSVYQGVLCSFAKLTGDDFGYGFLRSVDFINLRAQVLCTAIPPVPVPMLKLGSLRIDDRGNE